MRIQISLETVLCIALIALGALAYLTIGWAEESASPFLLRQERALGALDYASLPKIYAIALVAFCAVNILLQFTKRRRAQRAEEEKAAAEAAESPQSQKSIRFRTLATIVLIFLYALLLPRTPFLYSTAVFLFVMFWVYGQRNLKLTIPVSAGGALCLWALFIKLANLPLGSM